MNLERDTSNAEALRGYLLTPRAASALARFAEAMDPEHPSRALTLTGVYGTGKSAFAHFISALAGPAKDPARKEAETILAAHAEDDKTLSSTANAIAVRIPRQGLVRSIVTARHEPLASTVARALGRGADAFFGASGKGRMGSVKGRPAVPTVVREIRALASAAEAGLPVDASRLPFLAGALADAAKTGVLVLIDELGKSLEYAAERRAVADVFLLQQLAEAGTSPEGRPVVFVGLLHQTYGEYGAGLTSSDRVEWQKVQGRFEDVSFTEAPEHMLTLVRKAISHEEAPQSVTRAFQQLGSAWHDRLRKDVPDAFVSSVLTGEVAADVLPLHPVAALALPALCSKYAQHDRSLFTFLTSSEPNAFTRFLRERVGTAEAIPVHRLASLYDYFIDSAGHGLALRPQFQRWAEVHGVISDARSLEPDLLLALKTIGALNLIAASGPLRASRGLVLAALSEHPNDVQDEERWGNVLDVLAARRLVAYRGQLDEYRIWEGSEFDADTAIREYMRGEERSLATILSRVAPLPPVVAQRHSFVTGTLRYFERRFVDTAAGLEKPECTARDCDGLVLYWVANTTPPTIPARTSDGRPVVLVVSQKLGNLRARALELAALRSISESTPQLQTDGVARKEVQARSDMAERELSYAVRSTFDIASCDVWLAASKETLAGATFNARLSALCDQTYSMGVRLWNELVNRRELTSNGARARRQVIEAMLVRGASERLGIVGDGPEASLYTSVLLNTGIHRVDESTSTWTFGPPTDDGVRSLWDAVENFCLGSREQARSLDGLLLMLDAPPYGVKRGLVPLIIAAVLLFHADDVSVYYEGSFVPVLGPEHFEILLRHPSLFSVKHFELTGIRWQVFKELEDVIRRGKGQIQAGSRNPTLLGVVRPLVHFANALPRSTRNTTSMSAAAIAVRTALLTAREPDALLFNVLPEACGLPPLAVSFDEDAAIAAATYRKSLQDALKELDGAYERQLERCGTLIHAAFGLKGDKTRLRDDLRGRAQYLVEGVLDRSLRSFVLAAVNDDPAPKEWLEAVVMIIADRPADTWTDDDAAAFEMRVSDMARRFRNFERLIQEASDANRDGFDARRVTITHADGTELHRLVWIDHHAQHVVDLALTAVRKATENLTMEQQWAVAAAVTEAMLATHGAMSSPMIGRSTAEDSSSHTPKKARGRPRKVTNE